MHCYIASATTFMNRRQEWSVAGRLQRWHHATLGSVTLGVEMDRHQIVGCSGLLQPTLARVEHVL